MARGGYTRHTEQPNLRPPEFLSFAATRRKPFVCKLSVSNKQTALQRALVLTFETAQMSLGSFLQLWIPPCSYEKLWEDAQAPGHLCVCVSGEKAGKATAKIVAATETLSPSCIIVWEPHECKTIQNRICKA